ncbi:GYD family protein [Thermoplasmatales archaeon SM1-50]|nr:MAG: GYD family protein [Thermoplasmatales archaeon SM1-50]
MATYIILCRISPQAFSNPEEFKQLAAKVAEKIKSDCPGVTWKNSYATMGRYDVIDIVEADDPKQVEKAAMIIRAYGRSSTETVLATPWKEFLDVH